MLTITPAAQEELNAYFEGKERSDIRIFLASGGCCGVRLSMALDDPTDNDSTFEEGGFKFIVNKDLLEITGKLAIDMGPMGFGIESEKPVGGDDSGCNSCPGSCGK